MAPISDRDVVRYLRLEEHEGTADLLLPSSLCYLGTHSTGAGVAHYWSYPTSSGVAWVELDAEHGLGMCEDVPQSVREATPARAAHKMHKLAKRPLAVPLAQRSKPAQAVWIALPDLPACDYHAAWYEHTSFEAAVRHYGAKIIRDTSSGAPSRYFYIQLTSGRYACIESRDGFAQTVIISLEIDTRRAGRTSGGKVHVRDIEEILQPMGGSFQMPSANFYIGWSSDP